MRPQFLLAALTAFASAACYSPGDGKAPPLESVYFPTGLALDRTSTDPLAEPPYLYVASSDFDLQYRSSSLLSYDLAALAKQLPQSCNETMPCVDGTSVCDLTPHAENGYVPSYFCIPDETSDPCGTLGARTAANQLLYPGRCETIDPKPLIRDLVGIGAFATDVLFDKNFDDLHVEGAREKARLFLPVRGDGTLHWIDLDHGRFDCGQNNTSDGSCDGDHRSGDAPDATNNNLRLQPEPFAIAATQYARYIAVTHQTIGGVSLYVNDWTDAGHGPVLQGLITGLPQAPVAIAAVPTPDPILAGGDDPTPGFLVAYRNAAQIDLLRVRSEPIDQGPSGGIYNRYALTLSGTALINANSLGFDSRDIVIDPMQRDLDYKACSLTPVDTPEYRACALKAHQPDIYVANRAPSSLLVGALTSDVAYATGTSELPSFTDSVALTVGPSRVVRGEVKVASTTSTLPPDRLGLFDLEPRLFVVCFDSRRIFVYDPKRHVIEAIINTGRGPYALAIDEMRGLAYVAHFTDSYLGVVSLDQRVPQTYASMIASLGTPTPPRSSK